MRSFRLFILPLFIAVGCASLTQNTKKKGEDMAQLYVELGTASFVRGEYSQAITDLKKALEFDSKNTIAHNHLGLAYYGLEKKELAELEFKEAVRIDPQYSDAFVNLGAMASDAGALGLAREYYRKALLNLEYKLRHRALTNLAQVALKENKVDEARLLLHQSLQFNPDYCLSHFLLGSIYLRENNAQKAVTELKDSIAKTCVNNPEGHYQLSLAYMKLQKYDQARQELMFIMQEFPETAQAIKASEQLRVIP